MAGNVAKPWAFKNIYTCLLKLNSHFIGNEVPIHISYPNGIINGSSTLCVGGGRLILCKWVIVFSVWYSQHLANILRVKNANCSEIQNTKVCTYLEQFAFWKSRILSRLVFIFWFNWQFVWNSSINKHLYYIQIWYSLHHFIFEHS